MPPPRLSSSRRIIAIGHAALDRIYRIDAFPPQPTKVRAIEHVEVGGGMAANAAVCMARLGGKVELWSRVGDDAAGVTIRGGLRAEKVDIKYVQMFESYRSSTSAIIVDDRGERLIVNQRDVSMPSSTDWLPLERVGEAAAVLGDIRWLEGLRATFSRARDEGVPTVLDADVGAREALPEVLALTDYAIFSSPALAELGIGGDDRSRLTTLAGRGLKHVGVTRGGEGYLWLQDGQFHECPAHRPETIVDTTGAGDAFHGAFTQFLAEGRPVADCARAGAIAAAEKCTRLGSRAGLPTRKQLDALMSV